MINRVLVRLFGDSGKSVASVMINASQYSQLNSITSMGNCDHLLDPCTERLMTVTSDCKTD